MLTSVPVHAKHLETYRSSVRAGAIEAIQRDAQPLIGARVLHVNATAYGGGVAEILGSLVPLMRDIGILADSKVISGTDDFVKVTKAMHNALQGKAHEWSADDRHTWVEQNRLNTAEWEEYDY